MLRNAKIQRFLEFLGDFQRFLNIPVAFFRNLPILSHLVLSSV
jgi:hypothetical protein